MKRALILITVALITITVMFIIFRPDFIEKFWLWVIGLIGPAVGLIREITRYLIKQFKSLEHHVKSE